MRRPSGREEAFREQLGLPPLTPVEPEEKTVPQGAEPAKIKGRWRPVSKDENQNQSWEEFTFRKEPVKPDEELDVFIAGETWTIGVAKTRQ